MDEQRETFGKVNHVFNFELLYCELNNFLNGNCVVSRILFV